MIDLRLDQEYAIDDAAFAVDLGIPESQIENLILLDPIAMADGRMVIGTSLWFKPKRLLERGGETFQIELGLSGSARFRDLTPYFAERDDGSLAGNNRVPTAIGDATLYLTGTDHALLVPAAMEDEPYPIRIAQPLGSATWQEDKTAELSPGYAVHPVSDGNVIAMPLQAASSTQWLAFLSVDIDNRAASWSAFPGPGAQSGGGSLFKRLLGAKPQPPKSPRGDDLLQLAPEDFPQDRSFYSYRPHINQALLRDGRVYIYTKGHRDSPKWGYACSGIAEIGPDGRVKSLPFMQDYTTSGDEKKYGIEGRFTASGRFCILTSVYKTTDPWKGKQKLFDMDHGELVDVTLPRGYSKYRIIDHAGDHFWAQLWPVARGETQRIARFTAR
jgi:hypothetical protein